jgi:predicted enzyme related to lactoylglutathione lyase
MMHVVKSYPDGVFNWVDLATSDAAGAKAFYAGLFGWEFDDRPTDIGTVYTMCQIEGKNAAGLSAMSPDLLNAGIPPHWASYVKHSDVDAVAARITEAGGTVTLPPMDVMEEGRMVMAMDPHGASFGAWQPNNHIGAQLVNMPNTLIWNELQTRDVEVSKSFYSAVFGWESQTDANGYVTFQVGGRTQAGMIVMGESMSEVPPNWAVCFNVADVAASAEKVTALGGVVLVPPTEAGEMGKFSVVQDPQGAIFTIMEFSGQVDLPPGIEA